MCSRVLTTVPDPYKVFSRDQKQYLLCPQTFIVQTWWALIPLSAPFAQTFLRSNFYSVVKYYF